MSRWPSQETTLLNRNAWTKQAEEDREVQRECRGDTRSEPGLDARGFTIHPVKTKIREESSESLELTALEYGLIC